MKRRPIGVRPPSWVRLPEGTTSYTPADARRKAHVESSLRRVFEGEASALERVQVGDLTIDVAGHRVVRGGDEVRLTPKEFELLVLLARNADRVLTHRAILKAIWGPNAVDQPEHLWVLIGQLRKKIEPDPATPRYLLSEPWVGYRLVSESP